MEWAVAEGADVINVSTSEPADFIYPMAAAVAPDQRELWRSLRDCRRQPRQAAGDHHQSGCSDRGGDRFHRDDGGFSGREPVMTSHAVEPDIAAPGVDITAARAGGRSDAALP